MFLIRDLRTSGKSFKLQGIQLWSILRIPQNTSLILFSISRKSIQVVDNEKAYETGGKKEKHLLLHFVSTVVQKKQQLIKYLSHWCIPKLNVILKHIEGKHLNGRYKKYRGSKYVYFKLCDLPLYSLSLSLSLGEEMCCYLFTPRLRWHSV